MLRQNLSERRRAARVYTQIPITCDIIDKEANKVRNKTFIASDINSTGIFFEADEVLPLNTEINTTFQLPKSSNTISAPVRVVRVETTDDEKKFGVGVVFLRLADKDKDDIQRLIERLDINKLLEAAVNKGASDLHLLATQPPVLRIHGALEPLEFTELDPADVQELLYSLLSRQQIRKFEETKELDFGIQYDLKNRFRVNLHQQRGFMEATMRLINAKISSFEELNIPDVVKDLTLLKDGLIIIGGPTGSGKTTTIAAMVQLINQEKQAVIITLERPIEYTHLNNKCIIKQREIGVDTTSFSEAIKSSLRQDPNVIVVGEIDDLETIKTAMVAAEAGYLVIVSIHALNTIQVIDRLVSFFPPEARKQLLSQLANCLRGIVTQLLVPSKTEQKRILASEVLIASDAVKRIIRSDQLVQLLTVIQTGANFKMQSMSDAIRRLIDKGLVDPEVENFYLSEDFYRYTR